MEPKNLGVYYFYATLLILSSIFYSTHVKSNSNDSTPEHYEEKIEINEDKPGYFKLDASKYFQNREKAYYNWDFISGYSYIVANSRDVNRYIKNGYLNLNIPKLGTLQRDEDYKFRVEVVEFRGTEKVLLGSVSYELILKPILHKPTARLLHDYLEVNEGESFSNSGYPSFDNHSSQLSYSWDIPSDFRSLGSVNDTDVRLTAPQVHKEEEFLITLTVTNEYGGVDTAQAKIRVINTEEHSPIITNQKPKVIASDKAVLIGRADDNVGRISLSAKKSFDPEGVSLTFSWKSIDSLNLPERERPKIFYGDTAEPLIEVNYRSIEINRTYSFQVDVSDGVHTVSKRVELMIGKNQYTPRLFADISRTQLTVNEHEAITLDASGSTGAISFKWEQFGHNRLSSFPKGGFSPRSSLTFNSDDVDRDTRYQFRLIINDGKGNIDSKEFSIIVKNNDIAVKPRADVSKTKLVINEGDNFVLDASASSSPDGGPLNYKWELLRGDLINFSINFFFSEYPTFMFESDEVEKDTVYDFRLTVRNQQGEEDSKDISVTVINKVNNTVMPKRIFNQQYLTVYEGAMLRIGTVYYRNRGESFQWSIDGLDNKHLRVYSRGTYAYFLAPRVDEDTTFTISIVEKNSQGEKFFDKVQVTVKNFW